MSTIRELANQRVEIEIGYTSDWDFTLFKAGAEDYTPDSAEALALSVELQGADNVRMKIGDLDTSTTPTLDIEVDATASGSKTTIIDEGEDGVSPAVVRVRFAQGDTAGLTAGVYDYMLVLVDDSETGPADAAKVIQRGKVKVISALQGTKTL